MAKSKINHDIDLTRKSSILPKNSFKAKKVNFAPKSFRFTNEDLEVLNTIMHRLNNVARIKITHTKVLQIVLHYCKSKKEQELLDVLKELI